MLPTYNNASTLEGIVGRTLAQGLPVIVVNDGSLDATAALLVNLAERHAELTVLTHPQNKGKADAMLTGFAHVTGEGLTHVVTIDTDGQLDPEQVPDLLTASAKDHGALVVGARSIAHIPGYPFKSRLGRALSNLAIRLESGARVEDSQCGFRIYPVALVNRLAVRSRRYGYEAEVITRAAWAGAAIVNVPITSRYFAGAARVSHFKWRDSWQGMCLHARLLARGFLRWISPVDLWRQARSLEKGRGVAKGLAVGVFIGNLPLYGLHTVLSLYTAKRLRLHPLTVVTGSLISTPPLGPLLIAAAIWLGHLMLHGSAPRLLDFQPNGEGYLQLLARVTLEWITGGLALGLALACVTFLMFSALLGIMPKKPTIAEPVNELHPSS